MLIGELAKKANVNVETVRYYQRVGLLSEPPKPVKGFRRYQQDSLNRLKFIRRSKDIGFSLGDVRELLSLQAKPNHCEDVCSLAEKNLSEIRQKIRHLQKLEKQISTLIEECNADSECVILKSLSI